MKKKVRNEIVSSLRDANCTDEEEGKADINHTGSDGLRFGSSFQAEEWHGEVLPANNSVYSIIIFLRARCIDSQVIKVSTQLSFLRMFIIKLLERLLHNY